jgi:serine-type D-Ala-D-Ala carboxypeptidase (penicillin-binding protein 5/6)
VVFARHSLRQIVCVCRVLLLAAAMGSALLTQGRAQEAPPAFDTKARQAYLIEASSGAVLFAKEEAATFAPASMAKLLTAEYLFSQLKAGNISLDTQYPVSEYAWRTGGALSRTSTMFAALKSNIRVEDLLKGMIVPLANDACIVLAEGMAGTERAFTAALNARASELGLTSTVVANASGLPDPSAKTSVRDLALLARKILTDYPERLSLYTQPEFEWNKILQRNKNPLIAAGIGVSGFVTGFSENGGYGIVTAVVRDGKTLVLALNGLASEKERVEEAKRILDWGQDSFVSRTLFQRGDIIGQAAVYGGVEGSVSLAPHEPVEIFIARDQPDKVTARIIYRWPLNAPVEKDQPVGKLVVTSGNVPLREVPLYTTGSVGVGTLTDRAYDAIKELLFFWL